MGGCCNVLGLLFGEILKVRLSGKSSLLIMEASAATPACELAKWMSNVEDDLRMSLRNMSNDLGTDLASNEAGGASLSSRTCRGRIDAVDGGRGGMGGASMASGFDTNVDV